MVGPISKSVRAESEPDEPHSLEGEPRVPVEEMKKQGESPNMVVMTNSHDLSLLPPVPNPEVERTFVEDLLVRIEISPSQIPAEELGEIVRLNVTTDQYRQRSAMTMCVCWTSSPWAGSIKWSRPTREK